MVAEFTNGVWQKVRRGECSREIAEAILDLSDDDVPELLPGVGLAERALGHPILPLHRRAIAHEASFATADRALARAARSVLSHVELVG